MKNALHSKSIVWLLLLQMALSAVTPAWSYGHPGEAADELSTSEVLSADQSGEQSTAATQAQVAELDDVLQGQSDAVDNELDTFGLFDWESSESTLATHADWRSLGVRAQGETSLEHTISASGGALQFTTPQKIEIISEGRVLLRSRFAVSAVTFLKDKLVFVRPSSADSMPTRNMADAASDESTVQYLSFVDLGAYAGLLNAATDARTRTLPRFEIGVGIDAPALALSTEGASLVVTSTSGQTAEVPYDVLDGYSRAQQSALDLTANLVDPQTYETAGMAVEEAEKYFLQAINLAGKSAPESVKRGESFAARMTQSLLTRQASLANLEADPAFAEAMSDIQTFTIAQHQASTRFRLLWQRLSIPRPLDGPQKIREALAMMVSGIHSRAREGALQLVHNRYLKWGVGVAAAATLGILFPHQISHFLYEATDVTRVVVHGIVGRVRGMGQLLFHAATTAFSGFTRPTVFYRAYLAPEHRTDFIVGVTAFFGTALTMLSVPFVPVNAWLLARDLKQMNLPSYASFREEGQNILGAGVSYIRSRMNAFVQRQRSLRAQYLRDQEEVARQRAAARGQDVSAAYTSQDELDLDHIFADLKEKQKSWVDRFADKVSQWKIFKKSTWARIEENPTQVSVAEEAGTAETGDAAQRLSEKQIQGFGSAIRAFLFATESIGAAARRDVRGWNGFSIFRAAFLSPTMFMRMLVSPNFYNIALGNGKDETQGLDVPSRLNGGLIGPLEAGKRVFKMLAFDQNLEALHAWEDKIIPVEREVMKAAIKEGYRALVQFMSSRGEELRAVISSGGFEGITDEALQTLTLTQRMFLKTYVDEVFTRSMHSFLGGVAAQSRSQEDLDPNATLDDLKRQTLNQIDALEIHPEKAAKIVSEVAQSGESLAVAESVAQQPIRNFAKWLSVDSRYRTLDIINPAQNRTMKQIQVTLQAMEQKDAMPRALRAVLPQVLMKKSIGFFFTLVGLAGVTSGVMQPLHHELFGPNSFFHLGRMPFVAGNLVGLFITLFEGIPHKLQRDASHSAHFGTVPEGEDAKGSLVRWYFKQTFANPANNYTGNQKLHWKIFFGQLKPAIVLSVFAGLASLGRFDLDGFATYLFLGALNPTNGFDIQLEQGMEFASFYHLKDFPERLRNHPRVLEYLTRKQAGLRFWFAFWEKIWVDAKGLVLGLMTRMDFPRGNSQAFLRMLDPSGKTPTERAYEFFENWIRRPLRSVPLVGHAVSACEAMLTNNYEDWQRVIPPWFRPGSRHGDSHHGH